MEPATPTPTRRVRIITIAVAVALMLVAGLSSYGVRAVGMTWLVDDATCPSMGTGLPGNPFCKIQDGICAAMAGDIVSVAPGYYPESIRMRPGVNVNAIAGPALTTIDAAGQPCTETDFCTKRVVPQCSAVIFSTGFDPNTAIDGFTITGGQGLIQSNKVVGGGVTVFSSPTIRNNIITNNVLSGPGLQGESLRGAGVYVAIGGPAITNNTISFNIADPPSPVYGTYTMAYGGGLWLNFGTAAYVRNNVIEGNVARNTGTPDADSIDNGGGIVVFPGTDRNFPTVIDDNFILDNTAADFGGGVGIVGFPSTDADVIITNNVIAGNDAERGGGVYNYLGNLIMINNTIVDNGGFFGGALYIGSTNSNLINVISNNIIAGNRVTTFGGLGGGIFDLDNSSEVPQITFNNFWNNHEGSCRGDINDAFCIGMNGNIAADPLFVDPNNRDYSLQLGSPSIDTADPNNVIANGIDDNDRGVDGDGVIDSPVAGDVDQGAYESLTFCQSLQEICDGLDNNCDGETDEGFPDTDLDLIDDCIDTDDDADGALDGADCLPLDPTAYFIPTDITNLTVAGASPTQVFFDIQNGTVGSGTTYDLMSGDVRDLTLVQFQEMICVISDGPASPLVDTRPNPGIGKGYYYLVGASNNCGLGTLGSIDRDATGAGDACLLGIVDVDRDGSPSDLDCDDNDPTVSHTGVEICDNKDNDCNGMTDDLGTITCGIGECNNEVPVCIAGAFQTCSPLPGTTEVCDGLDNDCDTLTDEDLGVGTSCSGVGECGAGLLECSPAGGGLICSTDAGGSSDQSVAESCDLLDNDCDGATDNDLGQTSCGVGTCGVTVDNCIAGVPQTCNPGSPSGEVCDGLDNDCDGVTDNGFDLGTSCDGTGQCGAGVYECNGAGGQRCSTDAGGSADQSMAETCDALDNDCDGATDNGFNLGQSCNGEGQCGTGVFECDGLGGNRCSTEPGGSSDQSVPESCDGLDNNCDGATDEDLGQISCGVGECGVSVDACVGGVTQTCTPDPPGVEICDGLDNDCDGVTDNGFNLGGACNGVGECGAGVFECNGSGGARCSTDAGGSADQSLPESCDALDNDCDGATDNGLGLGTSCDGIGECGTGALECNGSGGTRCSTDPGGSQEEPVAETCDNLDNDCDGVIDNTGQISCGVGECTVIQEACIAGVPQSCTPGSPVGETCDGLDNDCDGSTDNGFSLGTGCTGTGECGAGVLECNAVGGTQCSTDPGGSMDETALEFCDGLDNDCDGSTDEPFGLGTQCQGVGACDLGVFECDAMGGVICSTDAGGTADESAPETCDLLDNDCDGSTDEDFNTGAVCNGEGVCSAGVLECDIGGAVICSTFPGGSADQSGPEICDALDNNCDGATDEGFDVGNSCDGTGQCGIGTVECGVGGIAICSTEKFGSEDQSVPEACDNLDNDCDGQTDEIFGIGNVCEGVGACGPGVFECFAGIAVCSTDPGGSSDQSMQESCDSIDNDCDGLIDEPFNLGAACVGAGTCGAGIFECDGLGGSRCSSEPGGTGDNSVPESCDNLDNDCDGTTDEGLGQTMCGLGQCRVTVDNCVAGSPQTCTPGTPTTEVCDGLDNDCDGVTDNGLPDLDSDGVPNCFDCAPGNPAAHTAPMEVIDLTVAEVSPTEIHWTEQTLGSGTEYITVTGDLTVTGTISFPSGTCMDNTSSTPSVDSRPDPAPGAAYYYLVKSRNACGTGTYGTAPRDTHPFCP